jgi:flagellar biosynthesis GTPase FlhF
VQEILRQSLLEMELMHRREELEQAELEQAVAISLALEEERLRLMYADAKAGDSGAPSSKVKTALCTPYMRRLILLHQAAADSKSIAVSSAPAKADADEKGSSKSDDSGEKRSRPAASSSSSSSSSSSAGFPEPKPLGNISLRPLGGSKALPPIGHSSLSALSNDFDDKRRLAEETIRSSQKQLGEQRKQEDQLRNQLNQVDPDEAERRSRHMREQRDRIVAQKKAEREAKVRREEEEKNKAADDMAEAVQRVQAVTEAEGKQDDSEVEKKRAAMRTALARRMKMDLIESEEAKIAKLQEDQFADLDRKLRQVEQLRTENKKREAVLSDQLRKQQANIARNVQRSAAAMKEEDL